jgi:hypothetical protein
MESIKKIFARKVTKETECKNDVFPGKITPGKGLCIVSFPGIEHNTWNGLTEFAKKEVVSTACVFFPDSHPYNGKHAQNNEDNEECWCFKLYTSKMPWGCMWFEKWVEKLKEAFKEEKTLIVVYKEDQVGEGDNLEWGKLGEPNSDGPGLGGSQRGEVAYLLKHKYQFEKRNVKQLKFQAQQKLKPMKPLEK